MESDSTDIGEECDAECPSLLSANSLRNIAWLDKYWNRWMTSVQALESGAIIMDLGLVIFRYYFA